MKEGFRQSMAWLHTWTGLVVGWVLFFVFVTGTAGYVDDEISRWMRPEVPMAVSVDDSNRAALLALATARLQQVSPLAEARSWTITLPHQSLTPREPRGLSIGWEDMADVGREGRRRGNSERLDASTGEPLRDVEPRATGGGTRLYRMHYALHYVPYTTAIHIVGICTMLMLLAVVTGVITHKKIFTDFFTFRPGKGQRSWLDAHNIVSVMSLPFFLMITYTGLVFFMYTYMPGPLSAVYGTSQEAQRTYFDELRPAQAEQPAGPVAALPERPLTDFIAAAEARWGAGQVQSLRLEHRQDEPPSVLVRRLPTDRLDIYTSDSVRYSMDGSYLAEEPGTGAVRGTQSTILRLHEGVFANWWVRWLYVISGLLGCVVIATGLILWTVKRRTQHTKKGATPSAFDAAGLRVVEVLNAGTILGLPIAVAGYFWANRLLPVGMADRAAWEVHTMFVIWGMALLFASLRPIPRAWLELAWVAVAAYSLLPLLNWFTTDRHLGVTLAQGDWGLAGMDLALLALGGVFVIIARKIRRVWKVGPAFPATAREPRAAAPAAPTAEANAS